MSDKYVKQVRFCKRIEVSIRTTHRSRATGLGTPTRCKTILEAEAVMWHTIHERWGDTDTQIAKAREVVNSALKAELTAMGLIKESQKVESIGAEEYGLY